STCGRGCSISGTPFPVRRPAVLAPAVERPPPWAAAAGGARAGGAAGPPGAARGGAGGGPARAGAGGARRRGPAGGEPWAARPRDERAGPGPFRRRRLRQPRPDPLRALEPQDVAEDPVHPPALLRQHAVRLQAVPDDVRRQDDEQLALLLVLRPVAEGGAQER